MVGGFAFITPSLNSLLSRWSDPAKQGGILGIGQSISSLARIVGPMAGVPLVENVALAERLGVSRRVAVVSGRRTDGLGLVLIVIASRRGRDYPADRAVGRCEPDVLLLSVSAFAAPYPPPPGVSIVSTSPGLDA